ncbi:MAG: Ig-like domain-containing protein [Acidimicrobiales bacterium]
MPIHHPSRRAPAAIILIVALLLVVWRLPGPSPAGATVQQGSGFAATVLGWTSWYGSYALDGIGVGYCIDHGLQAPDVDLGYAPTPVDDQTPSTRAAVAWVLGAFGDDPDPVRSAAVMLVLHDLMGAVYPQGQIDVDVLAPEQLAGFDGWETYVLDQARAMKTEGRAHGGLVGPLRLAIDPPPVRLDEPAEVVVRVGDATGQPVAGVAVQLFASGGSLGAATAVTATDGAARVGFVAAEGPNAIGAAADLPDPVLHAFASTSTPAQRAAVPAHAHLETSTSFTATAPTTTTTTTTAPTTTAPTTPTTTSTTSTTSTTVPPTTTTTTPTTTTPSTTTTSTTSTSTTSTTIPATTTTIPPTTTTTRPPVAPSSTTTTRPATTIAPVTTASTTTTPTSTTPTSTTTTSASTSTTTTSAAATVLGERVERPLPRTGRDAAPLAATGAGLALIGGSLVQTARRRQRNQR